MDYPGISIITPSFNQGEYLESTIISVISQNYPNLEYIIIDGGSSDNSIDIIKKYDKYLSYWVSEKDNGQTHAINKGLLHSSGNILAYLNSDDVYLPGALTKVAEFYNSNKDCCISSGNFYIIDEKGSRLYEINYGRYVKDEIAIGINRIGQHSVFFSRSVIEKIGLFNENLQFTMDLDFWYRAGKEYNFMHIDYPLASYRLHTKSKTLSSQKMMQSEQYQRFQLKSFMITLLYRFYYRSRIKILKWIAMYKSHYLLKHIYRKIIGLL